MPGAKSLYLEQVAVLGAKSLLLLELSLVPGAKLLCQVAGPLS